MDDWILTACRDSVDETMHENEREDSRAAAWGGCESRDRQFRVSSVYLQAWLAICRTEVQFTTVVERKLKVNDELPSLEKHYGHYGEMPSVWGCIRSQR